METRNNFEKMFFSGLKKVQLKDDLILNNKPKIYVSSVIAQYLLTHQMAGIRFLYTNYKKQSSSILNVRRGSGKCFQCVAFFDAIIRSATSMHILIICQNETNLDHWHYHIDNLLENVSVTVSDNCNESQAGQSTSNLKKITLVSSNYAIEHLNKFNAEQYDYLVLQDQKLQLTTDTLKKLEEIKATTKVILCSDNLMDKLSYCYDILKFCNQMEVLYANWSDKSILSSKQFKYKYGEDPSLLRHQQICRQQRLINLCNEFYLRIVVDSSDSIEKHYSQRDIETFQRNINEWKENRLNILSTETTNNDMDTASIKLLNTSEMIDINQNEESPSILNTASTDFDDFDTQMSPLIYSDSETELDIVDSTDKNQNNKSSSDSNKIVSPKLFCNQEHTARVRTKLNGIKNKISPTKSNFDKSTIHNNNSKRMNYKKLSVTIRSKCKDDSFNINDTRSAESATKLNIQRRISDSTDVQIIFDESTTPIIISSNSSEDRLKIENEPETEFNADDACPSPDLFSSFNSTLNKIETPCRLHETQNKTSNAIRDLFGAPDECDDIDLFTNSNVDIFEITKNNVFENVLCSAKDRITPTIIQNHSNRMPQTSTQNCLTGLRVVLPKLDESSVNEIPNQHLSQSQASKQTSAVDIVDLTNATQTDSIEIINAQEIDLTDIDRTPERKRQLTPSTRSCLKRHSMAKAKTNEKKKRTPSGWISTRDSPRSAGTPLSRRRFEKWLKRNDFNDDSNKISKPRNLFKEFKSRANRRFTTTKNKTIAQSPAMFSDQDD